MAPQRFRVVQDDSRSQSSSTREKHTGGLQSGISKIRRYTGATSGTGSGLKDVTVHPASSVVQPDGQDSPGLVEKASAHKDMLEAAMADSSIGSMGIL